MTNSPVQTISAWITKDRQTIYPGNFRVPRKILRIHVEVYEAFNSDGTDLLDIGYVGSASAYANDVVVSSTGIASVTLGAGVIFDPTNRELVLTYSNGGTEPTLGKALVIIEFVPCPLLP